jgi:hypothetical protein
MGRIYKEYKVAYIYILKDPRDDQIRYVGKTVNCYKRKHMHIQPANLKNKSHKNSWIKNLISENLKPTFEVIEEIPIEGWQEREKYWIKYYRDLGCDLTNDTDGGEGHNGTSARKGQKLSDDTKARMSASQKVAQNKRIAEGNYGSWVTKLKRDKITISITIAEIKKIEELKNVEKKYFLLELLAFSKMLYAAGKTEDYEVPNVYARRIKNIAKIKAEITDIEFWYKELYENNSLISDGTLTNILFVDENSPAAFTIGEDGLYNNVIKKYTDYLGYIPKNCEKCGEEIKVNSNHRKYCENCYKEERKRKSREYAWGIRHPEFDPDIK